MGVVAALHLHKQQQVPALLIECNVGAALPDVA